MNPYQEQRDMQTQYEQDPDAFDDFFDTPYSVFDDPDHPNNYLPTAQEVENIP